MLHAPSPQEIIDKVPGLVKASLAQCIRAAYSVTDQIAADYPILGGYLEPTILGQLRYVLVNNVVAKSVEEGLVLGRADWYPIANASGYFLEYSCEGARITFASAHGMFKLPKKSNFRLSRANENQLSLFDLGSPEIHDDSPALLMLHGFKTLNFVQLMVPGDCDGKMIGLAWSTNILTSGEEGGESDFYPEGLPIDPIPAEPLAEIALKLRSEEIEKLNIG